MEVRNHIHLSEQTLIKVCYNIICTCTCRCVLRGNIYVLDEVYRGSLTKMGYQLVAIAGVHCLPFDCDPSLLSCLGGSTVRAPAR